MIPKQWIGIYSQPHREIRIQNFMRERETRRKGRDRKGREEKRRILKEICKLQDPVTQSTQKAKTYQWAQPPMEEKRDKDLF